MAAETRLRFRPVPILITALLGFFLPYLAAYTAVIGTHFLPMPSPRGAALPWLYSQHGFQLLWALIAIAIVTWSPLLRPAYRACNGAGVVAAAAGVSVAAGALAVPGFAATELA